jgi:hypothetical protein
MPLRGNGAEVVQSTINQSTNGADIFIRLINNEPNSNIVYESATFNLDGVFGQLVDAVIARNADHADKTRTDIYSNLTFGTMGGEVFQGWGVTRNGNELSITHIGGIGGVSWKYWKSTSADPNGDMQLLTIYYVGSMFDFNHNGILDENEKIELSTNTVANAFHGYELDGSTWTGNAFSYQLKTPAATNLAILGISTLTNDAVEVSATVTPKWSKFVLEYGEDLTTTNWVELLPPVVATNEVERVYDRLTNSTTSARFYRLKGKD